MLKIVALLVRSNKLLAVIHFSENFELAIDTAPPAISPQPPPITQPAAVMSKYEQKRNRESSPKSGSI
jgi:hypothetical protein